MRKYQPIWEEIKKRQQVSITCALPNVKRLIKAVVKEKDMDVAYKDIRACRLLTKREPAKNSQDAKITFSLYDSH